MNIPEFSVLTKILSLLFFTFPSFLLLHRILQLHSSAFLMCAMLVIYKFYRFLLNIYFEFIICTIFSEGYIDIFAQSFLSNNNKLRNIYIYTILLLKPGVTV